MARTKTDNGTEPPPELEDLAALGPEYEVQVHRLPRNDYIESIPAEGIHLDNLKELYGGGSYRLRPTKGGKFFEGSTSRRVRIEGTPKVRGDEEPATPGETEVERLRRELDEMRKKPAPESHTVEILATIVVPLLTPVLEAMVSRKPDNSALESLELARAIAGDWKANQSNEAYPGEGIVNNLGVPLMKRLAAATPAPNAPPAPAAEPASSDVAEAAPALEASPGEAPPLRELATQVAKWLEPMERKNRNPELRAELLLDDLEGSAMQQPVIDLFHMPDALDLWAGIAPRVGENRDWYGRVITAVRELCQTEDSPDPGREAGDDGDAANDGETGKEGEPDAGDQGAGE